MKITLGEIADTLGARLYGNREKIVTAISFDSRSCNDGVLFAALKGEKRDGHEFIPSLSGSGAAVLCSTKPECEIDAVVTDDVMTALTELAKWYKSNHCNLIKTVAVTGSVGKTTTKDITACVLSSQFNTHKTAGNYNNALGVPMTLFGLDESHRVLVCEMGMSGFGEIEHLSGIACPDIGMITNIGTSHIEMLGSRENIAKAKLEIVTGMKKGSTLILNGDEPLLKERAKEFSADYKVILVGFKEHNDIHITDMECGESTHFTIKYNGVGYNACLNVPGEHNVYNALFAFCAGVECGIEPYKAAAAISDFHSYGMRQNVIEKDGIQIMADCYNASRESMCASLKVLCSEAYKAQRKIAVLGEMLELGEKSLEYHNDVGKCVAQVNPDMLFTLSGAKEIQTGALQNGYLSAKCMHFADKDELYTALCRTVKQGDMLLFKASRGVRMEEIIKKMGFEIK
ncbi:MAG: UDP-N-acetylmuramoyl-tripeptide--D-alanyl-D-alanine ligase [Ruminococcaceae bacterium]|nr:UDP-N-acetylmuramoyl-tripeptide--D-alanyl-D-alanine ligase [Oscillospiraceae bacterium]